MRLLRELGYSHVSHFPGGLTEWFSEEAPAPTAHASLPAAQVAPRTSHPVPRTSLSASFVDALADRSVGALFRLWTEIVLGCGAAYWLLAWSSPRFALLSNGAPVAAGLRGLLPAIYFSADQRWVISSNVDSQRLFDEELDELPVPMKHRIAKVEVVVRAWSCCSRARV